MDWLVATHSHWHVCWQNITMTVTTVDCSMPCIKHSTGRSLLLYIKVPNLISDVIVNYSGMYCWWSRSSLHVGLPREGVDRGSGGLSYPANVLLESLHPSLTEWNKLLSTPRLLLASGEVKHLDILIFSHNSHSTIIYLCIPQGLRQKYGDVVLQQQIVVVRW